MIQSLKVNGLNNQFSGKFKFHRDLNIFTGPNGSCKTTLLKLIWYVISGNLQQIILEIPFNSISVKTDSFFLTVTHVKSNRVKFEYGFNKRKKTTSKLVVVTMDPETGALESFTDANELEEVSGKIVSGIKSSLFFPTFRRVESEFYSLTKYHNPTNSDYDSNLPSRSLMLGRLQEALSALSTALSVEEHKFITSISTHDIVRLLTQKHIDVSGEINILHTTLTSEITEKILAYSGGEESKIQKSQDAAAVLDDIQDHVEQVTQKRKNLLRIFSILTDLVQKVLKYQSISITEEIISNEGIEGITLGKGINGVTFGAAEDAAISSSKLSSGEKQMLSFLCYNVFSKDTAIFIDEPELSLHVDWQRLLLPILLEQETSNQFFIATHSPFIYTMYPDKEFMLDDTRVYQGEV